jgi:hypothetical protein
MMDVHKVAQQIAKWWIEAPGYWRDPDMPPDIAWIVDMSFIESCYRDARTPWLPAVIEAHTRAAVEAAEARIVAWTEAESDEFLKSPKDSLEFLHGESLQELARCYRDGEHRSAAMPDLPSKMLDEIEAHRASLPPEVRAKLEADERQAQRQSLVRAMQPCEHGVLDFEDCGDCRKARP